MTSYFSSLAHTLRNTFTLQGRVSRAEFRRILPLWYGGLILLGLTNGALEESEYVGLAVASGLASLIFGLGGMVTMFTATVRRLHDADSSGWWVLIPFVDLAMLFPKGDAGHNRFGAPSDID